MKPKLGNAASLFAGGEASTLYTKKPSAKKKLWTAGAASIGVLCLLAGVFLVNQPDTDSSELSAAASRVTDEKISTVQAHYEKDQLVGTLLRADAEEGAATAFASSGPVKLTDKERAHLLDIISRQ